MAVRQSELDGRLLPRGLGYRRALGGQDPPQARQAFLGGRAELLRRLLTQLPTTATALARARGASDESEGPAPTRPDDHAADELVAAQPDRTEAADRPMVRTRSAGEASLGMAVHRVLELVDFADWTDDGVAALSQRAAHEAGVPALAGQVAAARPLGAPLMPASGSGGAAALEGGLRQRHD